MTASLNVLRPSLPQCGALSAGSSLHWRPCERVARDVVQQSGKAKGPNRVGALDVRAKTYAVAEGQLQKWVSRCANAKMACGNGASVPAGTWNGNLRDRYIMLQMLVVGKGTLASSGEPSFHRSAILPRATRETVTINVRA